MKPRPRKRFGQHFLHDAYVIDRIVAALDPQPGQRLVEIGPGRGALTAPVLARAGRLDVIELDRDLAAQLRAREYDGELVVHEGDALAFDFSALARGGKLRVFGNLPYNISTPLLFRLLGQAQCIEDMLFMLQKEVVERMTAAPGSKTYGRLTVMLALVAKAEKLFTVSRGAFTPPPRVHSAIVRIVPDAEPRSAGVDATLLRRVVTQAFSHRRKTLRNALAGLVGAEQIRQAGLDPRQRPETVDPQKFAALAQQVTETGLVK